MYLKRERWNYSYVKKVIDTVESMKSQPSDAVENFQMKEGLLHLFARQAQYALDNQLDCYMGENQKPIRLEQIITMGLERYDSVVISCGRDPVFLQWYRSAFILYFAAFERYSKLADQFGKAGDCLSQMQRVLQALPENERAFEQQAYDRANATFDSHRSSSFLISALTFWSQPVVSKDASDCSSNTAAANGRCL